MFVVLDFNVIHYAKAMTLRPVNLGTYAWFVEVPTNLILNDLNSGSSIAVKVYSLYWISNGVNPLTLDNGTRSSDLPSFLSGDMTWPLSFKFENPGKGMNVGSKPGLSLIA